MQPKHTLSMVPQRVPCVRRLCATCDQWGGGRSLGLRDNESVVLYANHQAGSCRNGAWRNFGSLGRQYCRDYRRWALLADTPVDPAVYSPAELFTRHIRMSANRAGPLPEAFIQRIDAVISDIESWHFQQQLSGERGTDPSETRVFYTDIVGGLFDALYYLGWSKRKPVAEITYEDLCQL